MRTLAEKMAPWVRRTRASGLVEAICPHGIAHPDSESVLEMNVKYGDQKWSTHGCDGCDVTPGNTP